MRLIYQICVPHTGRDYFDYHFEASGEQSPVIGGRVWVPFRNQTRLGLVIAQETECTAIKTKAILSALDEPPVLSEEMLALCRWVSQYYQSPLSEVIPLALPKKYRLGGARSRPVTRYVSLKLPINDAIAQLSKRAHRQCALLEFLAQSQTPLSQPFILAHGFQPAQINALHALNLLTFEDRPSCLIQNATHSTQALSLNEEQAHAVETICAHLKAHQCFLLQGVTGSGKTEVYLQVIARVLAKGKQVLILVPEIGLTPQLLSRFQSRFQAPMVVVHSNLNDSERQFAWESASQNEAKLVIGTRTAIFTPMPALGLIVLDEEHDTSFKQMEGVRYSARDTALVRAQRANIPVILGTATPNLESLLNGMRQKYTPLVLRQKALTSAPLQYQILDIRNQILHHGLAEATLERIAQHLQAHNQVLVFINRRGFAPVLLCRQCGWMADCHACDSHLTLHRKANQLICHHCGGVQSIPRACKHCHNQNLLPVGAGTQRIHEFLTAQFPETNILRIDRDEIRKKQALEACLEQIHSGDAQLIVGTQMLAKGHHFPRLTLVVVLEADNGFYNQDFRAIERLGQLLTQVAGRAGRAERRGEVLIQTHLPQHPLLNLLVQKGYESFAQSLLAARQAAQLPPYAHLALIRAQGRSPERVTDFLKTIKRQLNPSGIETLGPAPAPLGRKAGDYRMQLLLKSSTRKQLQNALTSLRDWLSLNKLNQNIRWNVDVDPVDLS